MQSRVEGRPIGRSDAVASADHKSDVQGSMGNFRINLRHGVSRIGASTRHAPGMPRLKHNADRF